MHKFHVIVFGRLLGILGHSAAEENIGEGNSTSLPVSFVAKIYPILIRITFLCFKIEKATVIFFKPDIGQPNPRF